MGRMSKNVSGSKVPRAVPIFWTSTWNSLGVWEPTRGSYNCVALTSWRRWSHYVMDPYATIRASCYEGGIGLKLICLYRLINFAPDPCIGIATVSKFESSMDYSGGRSLGTPSCNDKNLTCNNRAGDRWLTYSNVLILLCSFLIWTLLLFLLISYRPSSFGFLDFIDVVECGVN
jgi:hypothetical protein